MNVILILLGKRGAGKTSLAKLFESREGSRHIEVSKYLVSLKERLGYKETVLRYILDKATSRRLYRFDQNKYRNHRGPALIGSRLLENRVCRIPSMLRLFAGEF